MAKRARMEAATCSGSRLSVGTVSPNAASA
jgi:hypothetical protein